MLSFLIFIFHPAGEAVHEAKCASLPSTRLVVSQSAQCRSIELAAAMGCSRWTVLAVLLLLAVPSLSAQGSKAADDEKSPVATEEQVAASGGSSMNEDEGTKEQAAPRLLAAGAAGRRGLGQGRVDARTGSLRVRRGVGDV
ncbi:hypothetical protein MTO96_011831 [Rhipicephalus appendiculatus]